AEPFAETAVAAGSLAHSERIAIGLREVARGLRERLVAELPCRLSEEGVTEGLRLRRVGIGTGPWALERVAALQDLALKIARLTAGSAEILEAIVMRLELRVSDAPILDRHVGRQKVRSITLREMNAPQVRIGSALSLILLRKVNVVCEGCRKSS